MQDNSVMGERLGENADNKLNELVNTGEKQFACPECGKCFRFRTNLTKHLRVHSDAKPFACLECGKRFRHRSSLRNHLSIHSEVLPFACPECGKRYRWRGSLNQHLRIHSVELPFACPECGKRFRYRQYLTTHLLIHSGAKPFECLECGKRFRQRSNLNHHLSVHSGKKLIACLECGKQFKHSNYLKQHVLTHSDVFPCPKCDMRFGRQYSLSRHLINGSCPNTFACSDCGKGFRNKRTLSQHIRTHQGSLPEKRKSLVKLPSTTSIQKPEATAVLVIKKPIKLEMDSADNDGKSVTTEMNDVTTADQADSFGNVSGDEPTCEEPKFEYIEETCEAEIAVKTEPITTDESDCGTEEVPIATIDDEEGSDPDKYQSPGSPSLNVEDDQRVYKFIDTSVAHRKVLQDLRKEVFSTLTKSELEELIVQKLCDVITERAVTRELKRRAEYLELELIKWKDRAISYEKHVSDLKNIVEKCLQDLAEGSDTCPVPMRLTRNIGVQASFRADLQHSRPGVEWES